MPNGGSDCCGTCWFNAKNAGEAGYSHAHDATPDRCIIRGIAIANPFYTYCANHPHRRPDRDPVPIGPALEGDSTGYREILAMSPDSRDVRKHLLELLERIPEQPPEEYPAGPGLDATVVWQVGVFRDERGIPGLQRVAAFERLPNAGRFAPSGRDYLVLLAKEALRRISKGGPMAPVGELIFGRGSGNV